MPMTPLERLKNQQDKALCMDRQTRFAESRPMFKAALAEAILLLESYESKPRKKKDANKRK